MRSPFTRGWSLASLLLVLLSGCGGETLSSPELKASPPVNQGTLIVRANGEERAREGLTTKDGWFLDFSHVYVSLAEINAYQIEPAFDASTDAPLPDTAVAIAIPGSTVVDLAAAGKDAETVLVGETPAPAGKFNALSWQMPLAAAGPTQGYSILLEGTATKNGRTIPFRLGVKEQLGFICGDFVGDERKGILTAGGKADLEATFHLDHLFGEGKEPADSDINLSAFGFAPLAALAQEKGIEINSEDLQAQLGEADYQTFLQVLANLGHVGEGHCRQTREFNTTTSVNQ
ncbi:hypothetical protein H6G45_01055 [Synechocystis sp. FACHB-383]|uniref:hypothetical protein n=1 Tax=Synechocystis sp. FACHB-383 TaxID=2692864 RepID=UPI001688CB1E|nr:hypothetical protein [Synechocystis sp. FACHB-383]MBD2652098.1 hypothetical protein [Synechocystis sp. FACHB-383]